MPSKQASPRGGEGRSVAERMAREIIPQWTNASAANTMEYENALEAQMMEGRGPVEGLLHAVLANGDWATTTIRHAACPLRAGTPPERTLRSSCDLCRHSRCK